MPGRLLLNEIDAYLAGGSSAPLPYGLALTCEQRLGPARRRHLAMALLLTALAVAVAALIDHASVPGRFQAFLVFRVSVAGLCLLGAAMVLAARGLAWEAIAYGLPLLGEVALAAWACVAGSAEMIDRSIVMSLMLFAVLGAVPPVPGQVARVLAGVWFLVFVATLWVIEGGAMLSHHLIALAAGAVALGIGGVMSQRREAARRRDLLQTLRSEMTTAELNRLNSELERLTNTDALTGVANRRHFESDIKAAWPLLNRASDLSGGLGLLLVDVDQFKSYNDAAGHSEGDGCLRAVAAAMAAVVRGGSFRVARWGGEEFVVLAPGIAREAMHGLAERVRRAVEALEIPHPAWPERFVTASVGAAWCGPGAPFETPDDLLRNADVALYEAKRRGRNCVVGPGSVTARPGAPHVPACAAGQ